jgi:predicted RNA methylase
MLRKLAERLSRGKAFKRRLPPQFGNTPIFVSPDAQLKYMKITNAAFDVDLLNIACKYIHEGDIVWDIGANIGVFSLASASIVGSQGYVLAVEPDIWLANLIRRSIACPKEKISSLL